MDISVSKKTLRRRMSSVDHSAHSTSVVGHLADWPPVTGVVAGFFPMSGEIDVTPLLDISRIRFVAPRIGSDGSMTMRLHDPIRTEIHRYGFEQPDASTVEVAPDTIDVVLLPGLAFDTQGGRLGRGGGYYDRLLMQISDATARIGVTSSGGMIDDVPMHEWDARVDWIVSETGIEWSGISLPDAALAVMRCAIVRGIAPRMQRFPQGTKTSIDAARAVGCDLGAIAKSLVFEVDGAPVLVLCSGDRRVDEAKLARLRGGAVARPASRERVLHVTGFPAGGTPAVGHRTALEVVADASLARYGTVWSAGGTPDTVYPVALDGLIAASAARWADVSTRG